MLFFNGFTRVINRARYFCGVRWFKIFFHFYISSSLHVACCFLAFFQIVLYHSAIAFFFWGYLTVFCGVVVSYNVIKYSALWLRNYRLNLRKTTQFLTALSAIVFALLFAVERLAAQCLLVLISVVSLVYILPLFKQRGLRYFPVVKIALVALSWAMLLQLYPLLSVFNEAAVMSMADILQMPGLTLRFVFYFLFVLALCIPFEIRDLKHDHAMLKTLPQLVGVKVAKGIGVLLLFMCFALALLFDKSAVFLNSTTLTVLAVTAVAIWFSDYFKADYYAGFFVEAIPVLWLLLYVLC